jgi:acetyltransferase
MSTYRLPHLFAPSAVAVVGATERTGALGSAVLTAIIDGGFTGRIHPVNPKHGEVQGLQCHASLRDIGAPIDIAVVAAPAGAIVGITDDAIAAQVKTMVILTAGLGQGEGSIAETVIRKARTVGLRILGPNCLGLLAPAARLNASFARNLPKPGSFALISQSGAVAAGLAEWAAVRSIGFSAVVSLGDAIDIDVGDCLDYFAESAATKAILLYVEGLRDARKFMSAARKAARIKPVIVLKAGRHGAGAKAAATHTGALAGSDIVYDAAFHRAGCIRVRDLDELFATAETLAAHSPVRGDRIVILTNGGGLGVLAVDRLADLGGRLATLSDKALATLDGVLPPTWSRANPVDIIGDAPPDRYGAALKALLDDDANDAILILNCPTAMASPEAAATAVIDVVQAHRHASAQPKPVFCVWLGAGQVQRARFETAGIPSFETEADAVRGLSHLMEIHRQKAELLRISAHLPEGIKPDRSRARKAIDRCLEDRREWLDPIETNDLLAAYGIPTVSARLAKDPIEAKALATGLLDEARALAVKIHSRDIVHKSDVDGVRLSLTSPDSVAAAASEILERARRLKPEARIAGVTLHPMIERPHARELFIGMTMDLTFGPVIVFGHGGTAVEIIDDKALGLLPLDIEQARTLMEHTRVARLLKGYRNVPAVDQERIAMLLVRVSRLIEDNPEIIGLDLNPVLSDETDAITVDARVKIAPCPPADRDRMAGRRFAIRPYPRHLEGEIVLPSHEAFKIRPMRPDDDVALEAMLNRCSPHDLQMRFFGVTRSLDPGLLARLTQLDYGREMALVALAPGTAEICAVARLHGDANHEQAEFAVIVRTDLQRRGLGSRLMTRLLSFGRDEGYAEIFGHVLEANEAMLAMCAGLGFRTVAANSSGEILVRLDLKALTAESPEAAG